MSVLGVGLFGSGFSNTTTNHSHPCHVLIIMSLIIIVNDPPSLPPSPFTPATGNGDDR
jgi:hypothetical protein